MSRRAMSRCCWGGHFFGSNVGILPTVPDGCVLDTRLVIGVPSKKFGRKIKKRRLRLRHALLHSCCPDVTTDVAPTVDARSINHP